MKTLYLIRHAKSCWENDLQDFYRPIKKRGEIDANLVSNHLKTYGLKPDLILCSTAKRTKLTASIFIENLSLQTVNTKYLDALYDFSGESLLKVIKNLDNVFANVMVFGHNHALTGFVNKFGNTPIENVTTSGFVKINFNVNNWKNLSSGSTQKIVFPRHLK